MQTANQTTPSPIPIPPSNPTTAPVLMTHPLIALVKPTLSLGGAPTNAPKLWERIAASLPERDPDAEYYTPEDLAPLLGVQRRSLYPHLDDLFPNHEGEWRMSHEQAVRLIKRVCRAGKKVKNLYASVTG